MRFPRYTSEDLSLNLHLGGSILLSLSALPVKEEE
jgi:hypothetical protein